MKLSEKLKQDNDCGDFGKALEGYAEKVEKLENALKEAMEWNWLQSDVPLEVFELCEEALSCFSIEPKDEIKTAFFIDGFPVACETKSGVILNTKDGIEWTRGGE